MLPRKDRLRKNRDFETVYKKGSCYAEKDLLLFVLPNNMPYVRCGISVSKKVSKKAVERNKLKRQLSHIFHQELEQIKKSSDVIIVVRKNLLFLPFSEIKVVLKRLLERARLYVA